ncbi:MAG: SHOCT domain-containing protein [Candidatus Binatia bacterium]
MRAIAIVLGFSGTLLVGGCSPAFWGGTAAGVLGTGAGYEVQANRQMDRLEDDRRSGEISRREYQTRKQQIERGSLIY